jgi:SEC-C motif-containing protein
MKNDTLCPCGSSRQYEECCEPYISGKVAAETAEQLMRSRYTAYVRAAIDYLYDTTHPGHRKGYDHEGTKVWAENSEWLGLEIISSSGGPSDSVGQVEFIARYRENETEHLHHEMGKFARHEGLWYFVEGKMVGMMPITSNKVGRNESCPCGSGQKYKKCCGK